MKPLDQAEWTHFAVYLEAEAKRERRSRVLAIIAVLAFCLTVWTLVITWLTGSWPW